MTRVLAWLVALALAASSSGCLFVIVSYPDGSKPTGSLKLQWRANPTDSWKDMAKLSNVIYYACEKCFTTAGASVAAESVAAPQSGIFTPKPINTVPRITFSPHPTSTLAMITPHPTQTPLPTPIPTEPPLATPSPRPTNSPTPRPTTPGSTPSPKPSATPRPTPTPVPTSQATPKPSAKPSPTPTHGAGTCSGRGSNGLPVGMTVAQPGTEQGVDTTMEFRVTSTTSPEQFAKVNTRTTFRYGPNNANDSWCTGDDTGIILTLQVAAAPSHNTDEFIYHRCHSINRTDGSFLFKDDAFCVGSLGWNYCGGTESQLSNSLLGAATLPCGGHASATTCGDLPYDYSTHAACCSQYVPNVTANNAYNESIFVLNQDGNSPMKSYWKQEVGGNWEWTLGWDFQASSSVPFGGCFPECCPACGGAAAGTLAACYCRICAGCGGGEQTQGCQCTTNAPAPWISYVSVTPTDQFVSGYTKLRLDDAVVRFDAKDAGYQEIPNHAARLAPFDYFYGTAFWFAAGWEATWGPGTVMPTCGPLQTGCRVGQATPIDGTGVCNAFCDPGHPGTCKAEPGAACTTSATCGDGNCNGGFCRDSPKVCNTNSDCTNGHLCAGGQAAGYQLSIGPGNGVVTYGAAFNDVNHTTDGHMHGSCASGIQYASRANWGAQVGFADAGQPPWNYPKLTSDKWRTYTIDVTRDINCFREAHVINQWGCGGPTRQGGTGWTGGCISKFLCASSCLDPATIGHAGEDWCQQGGCYQHEFAELDMSSQPLPIQFGLEGGWASKHLVTIRNVRAGTHAGIK